MSGSLSGHHNPYMTHEESHYRATAIVPTTAVNSPNLQAIAFLTRRHELTLDCRTGCGRPGAWLTWLRLARTAVAAELRSWCRRIGASLVRCVNILPRIDEGSKGRERSWQLPRLYIIIIGNAYSPKQVLFSDLTDRCLFWSHNKKLSENWTCGLWRDKTCVRAWTRRLRWL